MASWRAPAAEPLGARLGVRARSVLVAVVVVSAALLVGGGGLVYALQVSLEQAAEDTGRSRASEVAADLRADGLQGAAQVLAGDAGTGELVQVLAPDGTLAAWSSRRVATRAMSPDRPAVGTYAVRETDDDELGRRGEWTVVATATPVGDAVYVVQVAVPVRIQRQTVQTVAVFLLGATPLLLAGVGLAVWLLVGRALRPVEGIRTEVAAIDAARLGDRVAVPATRDEIAALATTMNVMLDRLQASHQAQRAFVSDASHELRSPLATLSTAAELAARGDEATRTRLLHTINLELERLRGLVENLMTLARADAQDLAGRREDVDLDDLVDAEVRRLRATSRHQVRSDGAAGARARGRAPAGSGAAEPRRQRGAARADHRPAHPAQPGRGRRRAGGQRRAADRGRRTGARLRAVRAVGRQPLTRRRGQRPRSGHRPGQRPGAGR